MKNVLCSIIYNNKKLETIKMSYNRVSKLWYINPVEYGH